MITFLRRKGLGSGSIKGMSAYLNSCSPASVSVRMWRGPTSAVIRNDTMRSTSDNVLDSTSLLIRWGCTSRTGVSTSKQLNTSESIKRVNNKRGFRELLMHENPTLIPHTVFMDTPPLGFPRDPLVLRPSNHAQGRNLF